MKEKFKNFFEKESVRSGIEIALTIGLVGSILGYLGYDLHKNREVYEQREKDRAVECQVNPEECDPSYWFYINW